MKYEPTGTAWHALRLWPNLQRALEVAGAGQHTLRVIGPHTCSAEEAAIAAQKIGACLRWVEPCGCGNLGDTHHECTCTPRLVERLRRRERGRLYDLTITITRPGSAAFYRDSAEPFADVLARVKAARERRSAINITWLDKPAGLHIPAAQTLLDTAVERLGLSPDGRRRIIEVARTIDALSGREQISASGIAEAVQYSGEREYGR